MNIKEYISSGIVESYVLGLASEQERTEFDQLCLQYPELVAARNEFEEKLEKQAFQHAITPPAFLKEKVMHDIHDEVSPPKEAKIINMDTKPRSSNGLRFIAAASVVLFLAAGYFAYDFYNKSKKLETEKTEIAERLNNTERVLDSTDRALTEIMNSPNVTLVTMAAMKPAAPTANIYWDSTSSKVFLVVKNMPRLASDKQYQLWSLLDGKPTSLGLFDGDKEKLIFRMDSVKKANAFAITIEQRGNTGGPNLEELQTMGKTKL